MLACKCDPGALILDTSFSSRSVHFNDTLEVALIIVTTHTKFFVNVLLFDNFASVLFFRLEDRMIDFLFTILDQSHETGTADLVGLDEKVKLVSIFYSKISMLKINLPQ